MSVIAPSAKTERQNKRRGKQKARSLEHALFLLFQIQWVFRPISPELYFLQEQWFMQEVMGKGLDRVFAVRASRYANLISCCFLRVKSLRARATPCPKEHRDHQGLKPWPFGNSHGTHECVPLPKQQQYPVILARMRKLISSGVLVLLLLLGTGNAFAQETRTRKIAPPKVLLKQVSDEFDTWLKQEDLRIQQQYRIPITKLPEVTEKKAKQDAQRAFGMLAWLAMAQDGGAKDQSPDVMLTHDERLNLEALRWYLQNIVDEEKWYWHLQSATPYNGPIAGVNAALGDYKFTSQADADRYLTLAHQYARLVGQIEAKVRGQAFRKILLPKDELTLVVPFWKSFAQPPAQSPVGVAADRLKSLSPEAAQKFQTQLATIIDKEINPAINALAAYLEGDYAKRVAYAERTTEDVKAPPGTMPIDVVFRTLPAGVSRFPHGREYYEWEIRRNTTVDMPIGKIHELGLKEVARITGEMLAIQKQLGFNGTPQEFRATFKTNAKTSAKTAEEIGERLESYLRRIEPVMPKYFARMPKAPYGVKRLQPELEGAQTFGYYQQPTPEDPKGYYRFNGANPQDKLLVWAGSLIYHEILPGHHYQGSLVLESDLPAFRKQFGPNGYGEGWGEYSSELAGEMGMYTDPYDEYGRLMGEMMLAVRLVVDTGMNALGWPREKAAAYMKEHTHLSDREIFTETLRYSVDIPGQALAYRLGCLEFIRLREKAKQELGDKFDIREFHDVVLSPGSIPMTVLGKHVEWWIAERKKR
jgi:uncharacterized protein (DUF885 family)